MNNTIEILKVDDKTVVIPGLMPEGTVCFHIPTRTNIPKIISSQEYFKMLGKGHFLGYIQDDVICLVDHDNTVVIRRNQLRLIENFAGWLVK